MIAGAAADTGLVVDRIKPENRAVERIALFSGGLDSASGVAHHRELAGRTQLVSHYSRQKSAQLRIAEAIPYGSPTQARVEGLKGRGRGFLHRSFYFLCLGAAVASTYGARRVVQYENGVLAAAIPPAPAYFMTRHAHPFVHRAAERLFGAVLGGDWTVENPFLEFTKRECYQAMAAGIGLERAAQVAGMTESCWYTHSNQYLAGHKKPNGKPCGVCIPCIVRRTAI